MRTAAALIALLLALALGACGGDDDAESPDPEPSAPAVTEEDEGAKPEVTVPGGDPPSELEINDLEDGDGPAAEPGDLVTVHYVGVLFSDGEEFDASWDRGEPFTFQLGAGQVIEGWDEGLEEMRVGGRRELVIPPDQAYGEMGSGPIGPGETLVFVVDLLEIG